MGGCITQPKKAKVKSQQKPHFSRRNHQAEGDSQENAIQKEELSGKRITLKEQRPRYKRVISSEVSGIYHIEENVGTTTKMQGPKFVSNVIDGSCKILRVLNFRDYDQKRLKVYKEILDLEVYEDENGNMLVLQQYYCGPTLDQIFYDQLKGGLTESDRCDIIKKFLTQIYNIIQQFHDKKMALGNLNVFSFRQVSEFDDTVILTDLSFNENYDDFMGHANKDSEGADWQAFGFICQMVMGKWPPIYIPHKIQYMDTGNEMVNNLLKGRKIKLEEINQINNEDIIVPNIAVVAGYKLRRDVNKLLQVRKRRTPHPQRYFGDEAFDKERIGQKVKLNEEMCHRLETARIFERVEQYIEEVTTDSEEAFLNYNDHHEKMKKFKEVFLLKDREKKIQELKDTLLLIR